MLSKKFCPRCGSENVQVIAGGITGNWMCADCGFSGALFPEKEIIGGELKKEPKHTTKFSSRVLDKKKGGRK